MYVQFIDTENQLWPEYLAQLPHDFYHLPGYLRLAAEQLRGLRRGSAEGRGKQLVFGKQLSNHRNGGVYRVKSESVLERAGPPNSLAASRSQLLSGHNSARITYRIALCPWLAAQRFT